jgi:hypothetical protein
MKKRFNEKGILPIVYALILTMAAFAVGTFLIVQSRIPRLGEYIKRAELIEYAEAALYETFNRFRSTTAPFATEWKPATWLTTPPTTPTYNNGTETFQLLAPAGSTWPVNTPIVRITKPDGTSLDVKITVEDWGSYKKVSAAIKY